MAGKRYVRGDRALIRLLRQLPEVIRKEMVEMIAQGTDEVLAAQRGLVPRRSGALAAALSKRTLRGGLRVRIGIIGKRNNARLPYRLKVEFGQNAKVVSAARRVGGIVSVYRMRLPAVKARPFVYSRAAVEIRDKLGGRLNGFWDRVLADASKGVID